MKLTHIQQLPKEMLRNYTFDCAIAASGYEARARYASEVLNNLQLLPEQKIILGFNDRKDNAERRKNDRVFKRLGFEMISTDGNSDIKIKSVLNNLTNDKSKSEITIFVDYSSMTKHWYAGVISYFIQKASHFKKTTVVFSYSPSEYSEPKISAPNRRVGPIPGFSYLDLPLKQTALVIGLGYEKERALGLVEYLEPAETFAFFTKPAFDSRFTKAVLKNNFQLLTRLGEKSSYAHPLTDLHVTGRLLSSLALGLSKQYRVVLAPLGVKPFGLLCLLLAGVHKQLEVWRVSSCEAGKPINRKPNGHIVLCEAIFTQ